MEPGFELEVESTRARTKPLHGRPGVKSFLLAIPSDTVYTITKPCDSVHPCRDFVTRHTSTSPTIVKFTNRVEKSLAVAPSTTNRTKDLTPFRVCIRAERRPECLRATWLAASLDSPRPAERAPRRCRMGPRPGSAARRVPIQSRCGTVLPRSSASRP